MQIPKPAIDFYENLSTRERVILYLGIVFLLSMFLLFVYDKISESLTTQERKIKRLEQNFLAANDRLAVYSKLEARLRSVESEFKRAGPSGGIRSYLESTLKNTAKLSAGDYTIRPGAVRSLGSKYKQSPFNIRFDTTKIERIVDLLKELTQGDSKLLLSKLDITKSRRADKLSVNIDVSSITNDR